MKAMNSAIYQAMKKHIRILSVDEMQAACLDIPEKGYLYFFDSADLNVGLDPYDERYIDSIVHGMTTRNMWNVCQRFYSFASWHGDIDSRLLNC